MARSPRERLIRALLLAACAGLLGFGLWRRCASAEERALFPRAWKRFLAAEADLLAARGDPGDPWFTRNPEGVAQPRFKIEHPATWRRELITYARDLDDLFDRLPELHALVLPDRQGTVPRPDLLYPAPPADADLAAWTDALEAAVQRRQEALRGQVERLHKNALAVLAAARQDFAALKREGEFASVLVADATAGWYLARVGQDAQGAARAEAERALAALAAQLTRGRELLDRAGEEEDVARAPGEEQAGFGAAERRANRARLRLAAETGLAEIAAERALQAALRKGEEDAAAAHARTAWEHADRAFALLRRELLQRHEARETGRERVLVRKPEADQERLRALWQQTAPGLLSRDEELLFRFRLLPIFRRLETEYPDLPRSQYDEMLEFLGRPERLEPARLPGTR